MVAETQNERMTYRVEEIAVKLGISRITAYAEAKRGTFPALKLNHRVVIPKAEFDAWYESKLKRPTV